MEEGELVALKESGVIVDDSLRELRHGGSRRDGEVAEADAADEFVAAVHGHAYARQGAACDLVRCEDGAAVKLHRLGDVHLDDTQVGLDESIVNAHLWRQRLEASAQHRIELLVDCPEVGPLGADAHLSLGAQGCDGFDWGFAHDGACTGLSVDIFTYLAANLGVDSEYFCHLLFLSLLKGYTFC